MGSLSPPSPLTGSHDVNGFDCGHDAMNDWLRNARKSEGRSARCYVLCDGAVVVGYYALAAGAVLHRAAVPRALRANLPDPTPVIVLARLAVDRAWQGQGLGAGLLKDALARSLAASRQIGARALLVHAIDEAAVKFYARFGFKPFPGEKRTLFLAMETVERAV